jgi:hypothetical protein
MLKGAEEKHLLARGDNQVDRLPDHNVHHIPTESLEILGRWRHPEERRGKRRKAAVGRSQTVSEKDLVLVFQGQCPIVRHVGAGAGNQYFHYLRLKKSKLFTRLPPEFFGKLFSFLPNGM